MITEEEISHQNNNIFDLSHPNSDIGAFSEIVKLQVNFGSSTKDANVSSAAHLDFDDVLVVERLGLGGDVEGRLVEVEALAVVEPAGGQGELLRPRQVQGGRQQEGGHHGQHGDMAPLPSIYLVYI